MTFGGIYGMISSEWNASAFFPLPLSSFLFHPLFLCFFPPPYVPPSLLSSFLLFLSSPPSSLLLPPHTRTHSLTHSLTHSRTHSLSFSHTQAQRHQSTQAQTNLPFVFSRLTPVLIPNPPPLVFMKTLTPFPNSKVEKHQNMPKP